MSAKILTFEIGPPDRKNIKFPKLTLCSFCKIYTKKICIRGPAGDRICSDCIQRCLTLLSDDDDACATGDLHT